MSLKSREARRAAIAGLAVLISAGAGAAPAQAVQTAHLDYECKYPLIVPGKIALDIQMDIPDVWPVKTSTENWTVTARAKIGGTTPADMGSIRGLTTLKGTSTAYAKLRFDNGAPDTDVSVDLTIPSYTYKKPSQGGPQEIEIVATGTTPKLLISKPAKAQILMDELLLNMQALDATGKALTLAPVETNWDDTDHIDSDGDPTTFDVVCRPDATATPPFNPLLATVIFGEVPPPPPPPVPTGLKGTTSYTSATLSWNAPTDPDRTIKSYRIFQNGALVQTVEGSKTSTTISGLRSGTEYRYQVSAVSDRDLEGARSAELTLTTLYDEIEQLGPPREVEGQPGDIGSDYIVVRWGAPDDGTGVSKYIVEVDGEEYTVDGSKTSYKLTGLGPETDYDVNIYAVDKAGNKSEPLLLLLTTNPPVQVDTTKPIDGSLTATQTASSVLLSWSEATDNVGVAGYRVFNGATQVGADLPASARSLTVPGLTAGVAYTFKVVAFDAAGNVSDGRTVDVKLTDPVTDHYSYALKGSTTLKTLTKGSLPLAGGIEADIDLSTGLYTADLTLNQTTGRLTALGFLPVTAKIGFAPSGKTTGTLKSGVLTSTSKVRIKVQEVKLFGAIPLAGGNNCQTKQLSTIELKSVGTFSPTTGGKLAGTYAISDLNGCGVLNGLVSPLTAGAGNTIDLALTPKG